MGACVYLHGCTCVAIIDAGLDLSLWTKYGSPASQVVKFRLRSSDLHSRTLGAWGQKLQQLFRLDSRFENPASSKSTCTLHLEIWDIGLRVGE